VVEPVALGQRLGPVLPQEPVPWARRSRRWQGPGRVRWHGTAAGGRQL